MGRRKSHNSRWLFLIPILLLSVAVAFVSCKKPSHPAKTAKVSPEPRPRPARARLAIIIDDLAADSTASEAVFALHYPLTLSVLPGHPRSRDIAAQAHQLGYEVLLHLPMQSESNESPEAVQLLVGMNEQQVSIYLDRMLNDVPHAVGVNNHQGSRATADPQLMNTLLLLIAQRHLFFIDSRTTASTVAFNTARRDSVPSAYRNAPFLDDVQDAAAIHHQLELAARIATGQGEAITIGHPHPETLKALHEFLPSLTKLGIQLVPVSELVH